MPSITRYDLVAALRKLGFRAHSTASQKWKQAFFYANGQRTLFVLVRSRGIDLLETPLDWREMLNCDGLLKISSCRPGDRFAEYYYTDSNLPVHERVLSIAMDFVGSREIDQSLFQKFGIGRREWGQKYGQSNRERGASEEGSLRSLYSDLDLGDGEDVYLSDGMWLSADGSVHDRGR